VVHVDIAGRLPVGTEGLLQRLGGGGGAQPGVAVHVRGAQPGLPDHGQGVVLLKEQLPGGVEADRPGAEGVQLPAAAPDDPVHRGVPVGLDQLAAVADQRAGEPVGRVVGLPAEQALGAEPAVVDPVVAAAADPDDAAAGHGDVQPAAVGAQHAGRMGPPVNLLRAADAVQERVHPDGPVGPRP
jgi:hypothetical protein